MPKLEKQSAQRPSVSHISTLTLTLLAVAATTLVASPAEAVPLGCKFAAPSPLYYQRGARVVHNEYWNAIVGGAGRWNAVNVPINFVSAPAGRSGNVFVDERVIADATVIAETYGTCTTGGTWSNHQVFTTWSDRDYTRNLTATQKRIVATHELGHALGLGHHNSTCAGTKTVMAQGSIKWTCGWGTEPWQYDIDDINNLY